MKIFLKNIFLLLAISNLIFSQIENSDDWTKGGEATLLFNQTSFSEWVSGGENSISLSFHADYDLNYEKNGWKWDTKFLGDFGLTKISGSKFLRKTNDRFDLQSLLGKSFSERWSYSTVFGVKTQFAKGFTYGENDDGKEVKTLKTQFFSPVYIQLGVGLYWKKDDKLWVNIAPFTQRLTLVSRKFTMNLTEGKEYFGVKKGENHRFELGASVSAFYSFTPMENLELEQRLGLYSDYLGKAENVDLDYLISAKMKVNEKISTNLIIQLVYDDNAVQKLQTRQIFGIGVNIKLN